MTVIDAVAAAGVWLAAALVVYVAVAGLVLFYLPSAERLPNGSAVDAAFVLTLPLVLAATWLAALRR